MAKLSRTQKYAELRNRLENDHEIDLNTAHLSEYGNKLNDLQQKITEEAKDNLTDLSEKVEDKVEKVEDKVEKVEDKVEKVKETVEEKLEELEDHASVAG